MKTPTYTRKAIKKYQVNTKEFRKRVPQVAAEFIKAAINN